MFLNSINVKNILKIVRRYYEHLYRVETRFFCIFIAVIVLLVDYITGVHIRFPIFYVLPVAMAAWQEDAKLAYVFSMLLPLARVCFNFFWRTPNFSPVMINAPVIMLALAYYGYLIHGIALHKKALESRVRVLEGILPICASCKRIRNEKGEYEQVENYVSEHSDVSFSHTICPECGKKLYPEYYKE